MSMHIRVINEKNIKNNNWYCIYYIYINNTYVDNRIIKYRFNKDTWKYFEQGGGIGAKGKYQEWLEEDKLILLEGWKRDGLTDEQIAHNIGINTATLYDWKKKYTKISEALKKGREISDYIIENALFQRARGYTATVKKAIKVKKPY